MSKRVADKYITDRNWDEEDEPEEAGVFKQADKTTLERRPIKRAARRIVSGDSPATGAGSTFKGFTGFSGFKKVTDTKSAFAGLSSNVLFSNGSTSSSEMPKTSFTSKSSEISVTESLTPTIDVSQLKRPAMHSRHGDVSQKSAGKSESNYLQQLKSLNESVARWIKQHVDKNPYCILTPIFKDYEKYLSELEKKYPSYSMDAASGDGGESSQDTSLSEQKDSPSSPTSASSVSDFGSKIAESDGFKFTSTSTLTTTSSPACMLFTKSSDSDVKSPASTASTSGSIFGSSSTSTASTFSGFRFGTTSSVFGQTASTSVTSSATGEVSSPAEGGNGDDEPYVPPKLEIQEIKEDDAIYSKRCKLFFKKNEEWKEKGLGHLHLKPCGEKMQLLIRADTTLGNILLNIMLVSTMPLTRQGKNNVALVCIPNPSIDGISEKEMVPMLIRVKTAEDADELYEKLKEHKS